MQIGSTSLSTLPIAVNYRRDDFAERTRQSGNEQTNPKPIDQTPQGEITRIRLRPSASAQKANAQTQRALQDVPARSRSAVQSYLNNGPSIEERLGVELAGIDVFA